MEMRCLLSFIRFRSALSRSGRSPNRKRVLMHFERERTHLLVRNLILLTICEKSAAFLKINITQVMVFMLLKMS